MGKHRLLVVVRFERRGGRRAGPASIDCVQNYPPLMTTWMIFGPFSLNPGPDLLWAEMSFDYRVDSEEIFDRLVAASSTDGVRFSGISFDGAETGIGRARPDGPGR